MGRFNISFAAPGLLCVLFLLLAGSEGRLFEVVDKDNTVCAMLDVNFTVTFTAFQGAKKLRVISFDQGFYRNYVSGDCKRNMAVHFDKYAVWDLHVHFKLVPDPKYKLTRSVSFVPRLVFGKTVPSNKTEKFVNPEDATIGPVDCSYKCTVEDTSSYKKTNLSSVDQIKGENDGITYSVLVDVKYIQVQVSHVHREKFGPPVACTSSSFYH